MSEQQAIPTAEPEVQPQPCSWCGATPAQELELEPARYRHVKGGKGKKTIKVLKKRAIVAWAWPQHMRTLRRRDEDEE